MSAYNSKTDLSKKSIIMARWLVQRLEELMVSVLVLKFVGMVKCPVNTLQCQQMFVYNVCIAHA